VLHDLDGSIIPLSERFTGKAPLYRGDGFHIRYEGLKRIHIGRMKISRQFGCETFD